MMPTINTAAVMTSVGQIELEEREVPEPRAGYVVIRVHTVTICGSDIHYFEHGRIADFIVDGPIILGHETSGTIMSVGSGVAPDRVGQRVAIEPGVSCRICKYCLDGRYNLCPDIVFHATPPYDGSLQEYFEIPGYLAHRIPEDLSFERAALIEPLAVAVQACRTAGSLAGKRVLVAGAGAIGLLTAQVASLFGAADVLITDIDSGRIEVAETEFSLNAALPGDVEGPFDCFIECSGSNIALIEGIKKLSAGSKAVILGMGQDQLSQVPLGWMLVNEISLLTSFRYANAYPTAISFAKHPCLEMDKLIGQTFELDNVAQAFKTSILDKTTLRAAIRLTTN